MDFHRRVSVKGVPHIIITSRHVVASLCYLKRWRKWRLFWPYPSGNQRRRDFDHPREAIRFARSCLPDEVESHLRWYTNGGTMPKSDCVRFTHKNEASRGEAWSRVPMPTNGDRNPWRKCHTEHYWVWLRR